MLYDDIDALLQGRCSQRMKFAKNTYLVRPQAVEQCLSMMLHSTAIVKWYPDGRIVLNAGCRRTVTTKDRMNRALDSIAHIYQENCKWYVEEPEGGTVSLTPLTSEFFNGYTIKTRR